MLRRGVYADLGQAEPHDQDERHDRGGETAGLRADIEHRQARTAAEPAHQRGDQPGRGPDDARAEQPRPDAEEDQDEERPLARLVRGLLRQQDRDRTRPRERDQTERRPEHAEPPPSGRRLAQGAGRAEQREPQRRKERGERRRHHGHAQAHRQGDPAEPEVRLGGEQAVRDHARVPPPGDEAAEDEARERRRDRRGEGLDGHRAADLAGLGADGAHHGQLAVLLRDGRAHRRRDHEYRHVNRSDQ